jgi:hypothetical protein
MENINVGPGVNRPNIIACGADKQSVFYWLIFMYL